MSPTHRLRCQSWRCQARRRCQTRVAQAGGVAWCQRRRRYQTHGGIRRTAVSDIVTKK
ncbi:MAG: hypothetical protein LBK25_02085 [Treponema sp.]|nr:hypothetical protein [Treponema sp.]